MEPVDLLKKQSNEIGPKKVEAGGVARACFVCRQLISAGQEYYYVQCGGFTRRRHITCARKTPGKISINEKQQIPLAVGRVIRKID